MAVQYRDPSAIASVWHYRYNPAQKKMVTVVNDTYSYVDFDKLISHYSAQEGDFVEYGTNGGGGGVFQVRDGKPYAPKWGWSNNRAFNTAHGETYLVPPTDEEMAQLLPPYRG